jgi:hypothetical protein
MGMDGETKSIEKKKAQKHKMKNRKGKKREVVHKGGAKKMEKIEKKEQKRIEKSGRKEKKQEEGNPTILTCTEFITENEKKRKVKKKEPKQKIEHTKHINTRAETGLT